MSSVGFSQNCNPPLYAQIKNEVRHYSNILCILDKVEADAYLSLLNSSFQFIFQKETLFALSGLITRAQTSQGVDAFTRPEFPAIYKHSDIQN